MTDSPDTPAGKRRRRWISLGETIGVLALLISAASFWDSHREREESRIAAERQKPEPARIAPLVLAATVADDGAILRLAATGGDRVIQTQTVQFPAGLGVAAIDTIGNPRIEAAWFGPALRKALGDTSGKSRLPVTITTRYTDNGVERADSAVYDIGLGWRSRLIGGDVAVLEGITLVARGGDNLQQRLDARWLKARPQKL